MIRRVVFVIAIIFLSVDSTAQKVIQMENVNGVYRIACSVNGAKMKMIFDTGASSVSLSETMANFLYDNGYISDEDVLGTSKSQTADGTIHDNVVINLKDIEISGLHIKNVQAVVISGQNAPLLLGQTAIQKLGKISLNGNKLIINDYDGDYSEEELDNLLNKAAQFYDERKYHAAIDILLKYMDYGELTTYGYFVLIHCLMNADQYDDVIKYGKEWEIKYRKESPSINSSFIISGIGTALMMKFDFREAITYMEKAASIQSELGHNPFFTNAQIAQCYNNLQDYDQSISYSKKALKGMFDNYKTTEREINNKGIDNAVIGECLFVYALSLYNKNDDSSGDYIMRLAARCNFEGAIEYCIDNNINYRSRQGIFE